jgi:Leucine-rich repeat (LRR) protein
LFAKLIYHTQLKTLSLANNEISVIENVQQLTTLEKLNVSRNRLASLEGLAALQSLVELDVSFNSLQSVEARHLPPHLQVLNVGSNCIQHLQCFASLAHASNLTTLRIAGRPLPPPSFPPPPSLPIDTARILSAAAEADYNACYSASC